MKSIILALCFLLIGTIASAADVSGTGAECIVEYVVTLK